MRRVLLLLVLLLPSMASAQSFIRYYPPASGSGSAWDGGAFTDPAEGPDGCTNPAYGFGATDTDAGLCLSAANSLSIQTSASGNSRSYINANTLGIGLNYINSSGETTAFTLLETNATFHFTDATVLNITDALGTGFLVAQGSTAAVARTLTNTDGCITVQNGDGVAANPIINIDTTCVLTFSSGTATASGSGAIGTVYLETDAQIATIYVTTDTPLTMVSQQQDSIAGADWFIDEDSMATNSATRVPSQQSVKAYVDASGGGTATDIQTFTTAGANTWNKPANAKAVRVLLWGGGGGGGGGGAQNSAGTVAQGGAGGGGGAYRFADFNADDLTDPVTCTVGAAGTAGTGGAAGSNDGTAGGAGGTTTFGAYLTAFGGGGGMYGKATAANNGGGGGGGIGAVGGAGSTTAGLGGGPGCTTNAVLANSECGAAGGQGGSNSSRSAIHGGAGGGFASATGTGGDPGGCSMRGGGGGGGGGGVQTSNADTGGGAGGNSVGTTTFSGTACGGGGTAGSAGAAFNSNQNGGTGTSVNGGKGGGGGGGRHDTTAAAAGGAGGVGGGGGGGGGGGQQGSAGGNGGLGGVGLCIVVTHFN